MNIQKFRTVARPKLPRFAYFPVRKSRFPSRFGYFPVGKSAMPAEGTLFYGETYSCAYPLRFLFSGSPVSISSPFPGFEERGRAVPSAVAFGADLLGVSCLTTRAAGPASSLALLPFAPWARLALLPATCIA